MGLILLERLYFMKIFLLACLSILFCLSNALGAYFMGLGDLPGGIFYSEAIHVSDGGSSVVGFSRSASGLEPFYWTQSNGMVGLGALPDENENNYIVSDLSGNGTVVVGTLYYDSNDSETYEAFRWTQSEGLMGLGDLSNEIEPYSMGYAVSSDGSTVIGVGWSNNFEAFRWTQSDGMVGLGTQNAPCGTTAMDVSNDGSVVVGYIEGGGSELYPFRWSQNDGMENLSLNSLGRAMPETVSADGSAVAGQGLTYSDERVAILWTEGSGIIESEYSVDRMLGLGANDVSNNGSVVVGYSYFSSEDKGEPFLWETTGSLQELDEVLENNYGLDLAGWELRSVSGVSPDGKTIVGYGINPDGNIEAWIASLDEPSGSLKVIIDPAEAVNDGAQWRVDGGSWQDSGSTQSDIAVGSYTVEFKSISGWTAPGSKLVTIEDGQTATTSGTYTQQMMSSLTVTIDPSAARSVGAQWRVDGGTWHNSGDAQSGLAVGDHTVEYRTISGWATPGNQIVTIENNQNTNTTGIYTKETGSLKVTIEPDEALAAGAQWRMDGGSWHQSGDTQSNVAEGDHTLEFKEIAGWSKPGNQQVTITSGETETISTAYTQKTGALQVTLSPSEAVSAGAHWRIDGGEWHNSGDTQSNLSVGSHTIEYKEVSGWITPNDKEVTINADQTIIDSGIYEENEEFSPENTESDDNGESGGGGGCYINALIF